MSRLAKMGIFLFGLVVFCQVEAAQFWTPQPINKLSGYFNHYDIAYNQQGKALALFDDRVLGCYDANQNTWEFFEFSLDPWGTKKIEDVIAAQFSLGSAMQQKTVVLNNDGTGCALTCLREGEHQGQLVAICYEQGSFLKGDLLSDEKALMPMIAQSMYGKTMAIWINGDEQSEHYLSIMAAFYDGNSWKRYGVISDYKSVKMSYHQSGPQIVMNDFGDAVVVWKARSLESSDSKDVLVVSYFDGIDNLWLSSEVLAEQAKNKKSFSVAGNGNGDVLIAWEGEFGIETGFINSTEWIARSAGLRALASWNEEQGVSQTYFDENIWAKTLLAQGEGLTNPQVAITSQGEAMVLWLEGYQGVRSASFKANQRAWQGINRVVSNQAAYAVALAACDPNKMVALWIAEGASLDEKICYSFYEGESWGAMQTLPAQGQSLIDHLQALSIKDMSHGLLVWYDFFKEQLYYSLLKGDVDPQQVAPLVKEVPPQRQRGALYEKKRAMSRRHWGQN